MNTILQRCQRLLKNTSVKFVRSTMDDVHWNNRLIAIRGARGVGKTTLMLQRIKLAYGGDVKRALYVSLDSLYFSRHTLSDLVADFYMNGGECLFIDEVHKYANWSIELKNAYDEYPEMRFVFSGSSLLQILNADADLSRRCIAYDMYGLSFREYLQLRHNLKFDRIALDALLAAPNDLCNAVVAQARPMAYFADYLRSGYYPFAASGEDDYHQRVENIVNMIIDIELPLLCGVDVASIRKIKALMFVLASECPMQVDIAKLATMAETTRGTLLAYLQYLSRAHLLNLLYSDVQNVKKMQKPDKIYLENTNLMAALSVGEMNSGTMREAFIVNQLRQQHRVEYATSQADFLVDGKYTLEVGGKSKDGSQIAGQPNAFVVADNVEYAAGNRIPLYAFGFLY